MKKILTLKKTDTIRQAFELLKGQFGMIVCIIENREILLGIVSEGDLRRGVVKGYSLNNKLQDVMNKNPTYIYENELKTKLEASKGNLDLFASQFVSNSDESKEAGASTPSDNATSVNTAEEGASSQSPRRL